jgi:hypothetical protein
VHDGADRRVHRQGIYTPEPPFRLASEMRLIDTTHQLIPGVNVEIRVARLKGPLGGAPPISMLDDAELVRAIVLLIRANDSPLLTTAKADGGKAMKAGVILGEKTD